MSGDLDILNAARGWLADGHRVVLVTVARTWGSSPRPVGSIMAIREDGVHAGSVSGGCVEDELLERVRNDQVAGPTPTLINYGINRMQAHRLGLPCGGRLELVAEHLTDTESIRSLCASLERGACTARQVTLATGEVTLSEAGDTAEDLVYQDGMVRKVYGSASLLLIIGAGHLSRYVAQLGVMLDYRVVVCDPRPDYARGVNVHDVEMSTLMPDDAVRAFCPSAHSAALVTLTHDPRLDDLALFEALQLELHYVGALGSRRSQAGRRERLSALGLSEAQLARLHAPVGLDIGGRTPAEIAVSIVAELTATRRRARLSVDLAAAV
ncbi:MAG: XdhC family protein [Gammaproteobacteria bacterium]|nr:XdhC family protein [Gammaproteobacteria bacterium]